MAILVHLGLGPTAKSDPHDGHAAHFPKGAPGTANWKASSPSVMGKVVDRKAGTRCAQGPET